MIINPKCILNENVVSQLIDVDKQTQQNGIDLTIKSISEVIGTGVLKNQDTKMPLRKELKVNEFGEYILEPFKSYDVLFNEYVKIPKDMCALIITRSSLNRMGAFVLSGLYDSGFENTIGCMLRTHSTTIVTEKNTRIAQIVFFKADSASLYNGQYQK